MLKKIVLAFLFFQPAQIFTIDNQKSNSLNPRISVDYSAKNCEKYNCRGKLIKIAERRAYCSDCGQRYQAEKPFGGVLPKNSEFNKNNVSNKFNILLACGAMAGLLYYRVFEIMKW